MPNVERMEMQIRRFKERLKRPFVDGVPEHMIKVEESQVFERIRELEAEIAQIRRSEK